MTPLGTGIILAVVTGIIGLIAWWIKKEKLSLGYTINESDLFPTEQGQGKYYTIKIFNDGNKVIYNITGGIDMVDSKINKVGEASTLSS